MAGSSWQPVLGRDRQGTTKASCWGFHTNHHRRLPLCTSSSSELVKVRDILTRALSRAEINQLARDTGQARRLLENCVYLYSETAILGSKKKVARGNASR
jgi:hypothetical protein